jgi:hypothetical protein
VGKIFVYSSNPAEREFLFNLAHERGIAYTSPTIEKASSLLAASSFDLAIVELESAGRSPLAESLSSVTCLFLAGDREDLLRDAVRKYPVGRFVDYLLLTGSPSERLRAEHVLNTAQEYARLKKDVESLAKSKASTEEALRNVYAEIKSISSALSQGLVKELEKRVALEARYIRVQRLNRQFEDILRKLYAATDVNNLLDTIPDIKEIVRAGSISLYLLEDSDTLGTYLKPLVWDQSFLTHPDFTRHIALLPSVDFASSTARTGKEIALAEAGADPRHSPATGT